MTLLLLQTAQEIPGVVLGVWDCCLAGLGVAPGDAVGWDLVERTPASLPRAPRNSGNGFGKDS